MNGDVPVITKKLVGQLNDSSDPQIAVSIQLTLSFPAEATAPVPVVMEVGRPKTHRYEFAACLNRAVYARH